MTTVTTIGVGFVTIRCGTCGEVFAMAEGFYDARRADHQTWYCPNGHPRYFLGRSDLEEAKANAAFWRERAESRAETIRQKERSLFATKGHMTRIKKRIASGVCPCCKRTFSDLARHMGHKHPDYGKGEPHA